MSRDMMAGFELYQPDTLEGAVELLGRFGEEGWALAGGNDSYDWFKDRVKRPRYVVELTGIEALRGIRETADGGVEIGALTTLSEVERSEVIRSRYGVLAQAAGRVASPQIRNTGTLGGNLCQDARCWYYRYGVDCYRAGGNTCYADTPEGQNREHCLWGADRCVAVSPSDTAPALVVLKTIEIEYSLSPSNGGAPGFSAVVQNTSKESALNSITSTDAPAIVATDFTGPSPPPCWANTPPTESVQPSPKVPE